MSEDRVRLLPKDDRCSRRLSNGTWLAECNLPRHHEGDCAPDVSRDEVAAALADVVVKSVDYGTQDGGFVAMYLLPTGPIHRAIPLLQRLGYVVRPRPDGTPWEGLDTEAEERGYRRAVQALRDETERENAASDFTRWAVLASAADFLEAAAAPRNEGAQT